MRENDLIKLARYILQERAAVATDGKVLLVDGTSVGKLAYGDYTFISGLVAALAAKMPIDGTTPMAGTLALDSGFGLKFIDAGTGNLQTVIMDTMHSVDESLTVPHVTGRLYTTWWTAAGAGNVGAGEDTLVTKDMPANYLNVNGQYVSIDVFGTCGANANGKTIKVYFGSTVIYTSGSVVQNGGTWHLNCEIYRTGASAQVARATMIGYRATGLTSFADQCQTSAPGEALNAAVTIKVTGTATSDDDIKALYWRLGLG